MDEQLSRRELLKTAAATLSYLAVDGSSPAQAQTPLRTGVSDPANGAILPLDSTSGVFIPPRGESFQKFSFGFPEPSVAFNGLSLSFRIHTFENTYGLDRERMHVTRDGDGLLLECSGFVWAGGQQKVDGMLRSRIRPNGRFIEWDVRVEMDQPIKSVASIVRGVPRGRIAAGAEDFANPGDEEILLGYPWGAARQPQARGINTPLAVIEAGKGDYFFLSCLMDQVRVARLYFQPGAEGYRVELVHEQAGWNRSNRLEGATWRAGRVGTADAAFRQHFEHVERAYHLPTWERRTDVPAWFRNVELVLSIHGMHWTGYIFNDFAKALRTLEWTSKQIAPEKVMVFLPAWDGRYYWDYPIYKVDERLGGEEGFRRLLREGHRMGFHFVPMFGLNAANTELPDYTRVVGASTHEIDGNTFTLGWVDWDNDRHDEGWGRYMNVGVDSWRRWIRDSVARIIDRYGVDGYFLDIAAGWVNNREADMHEGIRQLVQELRARYPDVLPVGEFSYDALQGILPVYQIFPATGYPPAFEKYCRTFSHLSHPAPGRGSSGVHESGFGRFNPQTLSLSPHEIPTVTVVDDTFDEHRDVMAAIIARAKQRGRGQVSG
ncbi:MAG TPA: hypothetical protein VNF73_00925 [Candidatus Saccharimonadales bacterium]|nr:hypothetical protein [Candidatus Saccharimonadales bacterium]